MLGIKALFAALGRLTTAVTHSAELFEAANQHLEQQLGFTADKPDQLVHEEKEEAAAPARRNGRK